ncbi:hypothetical protein MRB53_010022 [Persea americana]|uniref:Uncharacterized protein n=1 Tax=Persea americana TaxID=3435 RepID=A0ACC2LQV9_PERAE|nr:hypothetical protein MRB53_010022 [Persea americana]
MADFGDFQLDPNDEFIKLLSSLLQRVAESNYWEMPVGTASRFSAFDCITRPSISIQSYLERIVRLADCSPSCYVVAYIYLDRFIKNQPWCPITFYNVHFLVLTSVMVSAKFMDDIHYNNGYYAQIGAVSSTKYMNFLEKNFLFDLNFELNVTVSDFYSYVSLLHTEMVLESPQLERAPIKLQCSCCSEGQCAPREQQLTI